MSRLWALVISIIYAAGGLITGYYGYALRLEAQAAESGLDVALVQEFVQSNYILVGLGLFLLALLLHMSQIGKAKSLDKVHVKTESELKGDLADNERLLARLNTQMEEDERVLDFCRVAIAEATARDLNEADPDSAVDLGEPPRDYPVA